MQLVRALMTSASEGDQGPRHREVVEQTLLDQVRAYVRQNLRDPSLGPDSIAAALAVSRRQLLRAGTPAGFSLEQYVIARRLEAARAELSEPAGRARSTAAVASSWEFREATHFARRCKAAYGVAPREWRRLARGEAGTSLEDAGRPTARPLPPRPRPQQR